MIAYCLADFFNLQLLPTGREPNKADVRDGVDELVMAATQVMGSANEITVRLYGGWNGDPPHSRVPLREMTEQVLRSYPGRRGPVRLRLQLAEAPVLDPSLRLLRSRRRIHYPQFLASIEVPAACPHQGNCTLKSLRSWSRGHCPDLSCGVQLGDVASGYRQKMVDTLLTADALAIAHEQLADVILIASDDDDMLPAILALKNRSLRTVCLRRRPLSSHYYAGILERDGVTTHQW